MTGKVEERDTKQIVTLFSGVLLCLFLSAMEDGNGKKLYPGRSRSCVC